MPAGNIVFRATIRSSGPRSSTSEIDGNRPEPVVPPVQLLALYPCGGRRLRLHRDRDELGWMDSIENVCYYY
jgi:hypothetical protein